MILGLKCWYLKGDQTFKKLQTLHSLFLVIKALIQDGRPHFTDSITLY